MYSLSNKNRTGLKQYALSSQCGVNTFNSHDGFNLGLSSVVKEHQKRLLHLLEQNKKPNRRRMSLTRQGETR
jgi:hypothetical protein